MTPVIHAGSLAARSTAQRVRTLTVRTPEGIEFPLLPASPVSRFLALAIDKVVVFILSSVVATTVGLLGILSGDLALALGMVLQYVLAIGYPIFTEWTWRGRTLGKWILRLQVMDEQGLRLQFSQVVIRNLLRFVDALPMFYLVGGLTCVLNRHGQRLGDIAANTIVVWHPHLREPDLDQVLPHKFNSLRAYPHLAARLRQNVSPSLANTALQALVRRSTLEDDARLSLFAEIRRRMTAIVSFPPEAVEGISDEQYVRNVADILFR